MIDLKALQKKMYDNKVQKGFNTTDIYKEFCLIHEEVSEACRAHYKKLPDVGEELADVIIYLLGLSEILGLDIEDEIVKKIEKNEKREYKKINGVLTKINN
jgi:NTP pyrophosphatase (non-canonical NTP hydrolase)